MTNISNPGNAPLPCPPWCTTDHAAQDARTDRDATRIAARIGRPPEWMARWHTTTVATVHNPEAASRPVLVTLYRDDSLVDPDPQRAVISAEHADCMTPDTAAQVSAAILAAVKVATGHPETAAALVKIAPRLRVGEPRCAQCVAGDHDQCTGSPAGGNACRPCCWPSRADEQS